MSDRPSLAEIRENLPGYLADECADMAWDEFADLLSWPTPRFGSDEWAELLGLLTQTAREVCSGDLLQAFEDSVGAADDPQRLYRLANQLIRFRAPELAVGVLSHARSLDPGSLPLLHELVAALELLQLNAEAVTLLEQAGRADFLSGYLLAFNRIRAGDVDGAREAKGLLQASGATDQFMVQRLDGIFHRFDRLTELRPALGFGLREWHYVYSGGLLLHLADAADLFSEPGFRRTARGHFFEHIEDSAALIAAQLRRTAQVLELWQSPPQRVLVFDDPNSRIVGQAAARIFGGVPLESVLISDKPGMIVCDDPGTIIRGIWAEYLRHRPGQIIFGQASNATLEWPLTLDITGYRYFERYSPWERYTIWEADRPELPDGPPAGSAAELAAEIVASPGSPGDSELAELLVFAEQVGQIRGEFGTATLRESGTREPQWLGPFN